MSKQCFGLKLDRLYTHSKRCPSLFITLTMMLSRYFKNYFGHFRLSCTCVAKSSCVYPMLRTSMRHQRSIHTIYATLSSGIRLIVPRVTSIFSKYTRDFRRVFIRRKYKWQVGYSMECSGQQNKCRVKGPMIGRLNVKPSNIQRFSCILIACIFYGIRMIIYKICDCITLITRVRVASLNSSKHHLISYFSSKRPQWFPWMACS